LIVSYAIGVSFLEFFILISSLQGLTRQSILMKKTDARVEPAHDNSVQAALF